MTVVLGSIQLGYKDAAWFTANPTIVLLQGQKIHLQQTGTYKIGDGVTALSGLSFLGSFVEVQGLPNVLLINNTTSGNSIKLTDDDLFYIGTDESRYIYYGSAFLNKGIYFVNTNSSEYLNFRDGGGIDFSGTVISMAEIGQLSGVTSPIQTQINTKFATASFTDTAVTSKLITGYVSGSGVVASTDTILQAINKLNGNIGALTTGVSSVFGRTGAVVAALGDYTTTLVTEGTRLYFTTARVDTQVATYTGDVTLSGTTFAIGANKVLNSMISSVAWSKITSTPTTISGYGITDTTAQLLGGLSITGSSITSADSILSAFGKVQNQINGLLGGAIYKGTYNATTNTPTLVDGTGTAGYYYVVNVAGNQNFGSGVINFNIGDWAIYNGTIWQKVDNTDAVSDVNGAIGSISLVGTANRITVTSNTWDISATFEALLGKVASPLSQFATTTSAQLRTVLSDENGTGVALFDSCTSATFITPILGTPTSGNLANCTFPTLNQNTTGSAASLSISGQTGLLTFTGLTSTNRIKTVRDAADTILELGGSYTPTGTWTSLTMVTPVLGTPTSGTLTNCTLPVGGITGLGTGVATFLAAPSSANLLAAVTDETGTGKLVFASSPVFGTAGASDSYIFNIGSSTAQFIIREKIGSTTQGALYLGVASGSESATNYTFNYNGTLNINTQTTTSALALMVGGSSAFTITPAVTGSTAYFSFSTRARTNVSTTANIPVFDVSGNTQTWAAGTVALQYFNYFHSQTMGFASGSTATYVASAVFEYTTRGTNATFGTTSAIYIPTLAYTTTTLAIGIDVEAPTGATTNLAARFSGNVSLATSGNGFYIKEGSNATMGTATLVGGTVVVNTTKVTASSRIFLETQGGTITNIGTLYVSARTAGTSFTVSSSNVLDASTVAWIIMEPA